MSDKMGEHPEALAGLAMTIQREHEQLKKKTAEVEKKSAGSEVLTAVVVVVAMVAMLALMMFMNSG